MLEPELRAAAEPLGIGAVDRALRAMAAWHRDRGLPVPGVRLARHSPGHRFDLYLDEPADPPPPWRATANRRVWHLDAQDADAVELVPAAREGGPPYPSLVTIGLDEKGARLLLNLEALGSLDVSGDDDAARSVVAALAIELAASPWSDGIQITVVGTVTGLDDVGDTRRIRHVAGVDEIVRGSAGQAPQVVLVAERLDPQAHEALERLAARFPRTILATVTTRSHRAEWVVDLASDATTGAVLQPADIAFHPQRLSPATYALALHLSS